MKKELDLLKKYVDAAAPSGFEKEAFDVMAEHLSTTDVAIERDNLGSLVATKMNGEDLPMVMVAGHLDEIGFMITEITDTGYLKFHPLGGWWGQVMLAQKMTIVNNDGKRYNGVIGAKPPHMLSVEERAKPVAIKDMFIDLGVSSKEEVLELGINIGNCVVPYCEFEVMGNKNYLLAKAWDNRIGCYIAAEVFIKLYNEKLNVNLASVGTVQEEVGCRGSKTSSHMVKPDIGFAVDVGLAADMPGLEGEVFKSKLGEGPLVTLFDSGLLGHVGLRKHMVKVAEEKGIKYQYAGLAAGGTDGGPMHLSHIGAPTIALGIATRYIHSNIGIIHYDDVVGAIDLLVEVIRSLDKNVVDTIIKN